MSNQAFISFPGDTPGMGMAEQGLPQSDGPNAIPARKGHDAEPIGERCGWHPETQGRQRGAVAPNGRHRAAFAYGKALRSVGGSQSPFPLSLRRAA